MKLRILYIEDEPLFAEIFKQSLQSHNVEINIAKNGTEGARLYEKLTPPLVFLDIRMPGVSGYVALRRIKKFASDNNLNVKVIMCSSNKNKEDIADAINYGADDFLGKPYNTETLIEKIKKHFPDFT
ncbi:MAG: response regulator [Spirochaetia bacterium]|nr:response regulator [Spirochaetia bacterium]